MFTTHVSSKTRSSRDFKKWFWPKLAKFVPTDVVVDRVLATLGTTETPEELLQIAKAFRGELAKELDTSVLEGEGLQGA